MQYVRPYRDFIHFARNFLLQPDNPNGESAESAWNYRLALDRQGSLWKIQIRKVLFATLCYEVHAALLILKDRQYDFNKLLKRM